MYKLCKKNNEIRNKQYLKKVYVDVIVFINELMLQRYWGDRRKGTSL